MPDPDPPLDPNSPPPADSGQAPQVDDAFAEAMLGVASGSAESPTVISKINPEEIATGTRQSAVFTGGANLWQPPSLEEAAQLFPNYEVFGLLGRGGMGAVYKARQIELDRFVAIKLLPLEISADADFADRFRREARAMAKLNHPNIIAVHEFGKTISGHLFFVMEFVDGANLHAIIHGPGLDPAQALSITVQVCEALAYAHEQGVVHRDIKPANVMVDQRSRAKVADFGLARLTDPSAEQMGHTMTGTVMGTPDYMAPEQMKGMNVDHRADIYALGVMLYEMLCKDVPRGFFDPPSLRAGVDARLDDVVRRAMQQQPEKRYQQTTEMRTDVDQIRTSMVAPSPSMLAAVGTPVPRLPQNVVQPKASPSAPPSLPETPRQSKAGLWIGLAAAVLILGTLAFFFLPPSKPKAAPTAKVAPAPSATPQLRVFDGEAKVLRQPGSTTTASPPASAKPAEQWRDWIAEMRTKGRLSAYFEEKGTLAVKRDKGGVSVSEEDLFARDMAVRATWTQTSGNGPDVRVRVNKDIDRAYVVWTDANRVFLAEGNSTSRSVRSIKQWPVPAGFDDNAELVIELRIVGDLLTVRLNGREVGTARDSAISTAGLGGAFLPQGTAVAKLEYLDLDRLVARTPAQPSNVSTEPWQDLIPAGGWPAPFIIENGVLSRPARTMAQRKWNASVRDCAWRVTRRWDGGWYDLQLGLRSRGNTGVRLEFLQPPQPDVILVRITSNKEKLDEGRTTLRYEKGDIITIEFRAVGSRITASINGELLASTDEYTTTNGAYDIWSNYGDPPAFHKVEFLNLDAVASAREQWRDWMVEAQDKLFFPDRFEKTGDRFVSRESAGVSWEYSLTARNMAVRATWLPLNEPPLIPEVQVRKGSGGSSRHYAVRVVNDKVHLSERHHTGDTTGTRTIQEWPVPAGFDPKAEQVLELRVVDNLLAVRLNGLEVGNARDSALSEPGTGGAFVTKGTTIRKLEYVNLDAR